jgi:hypothetical protein
MKIDKRTSEGKKLLDDIAFDTRMSKNAIRDLRILLAEMILDPHEEDRVAQPECLYCYYKSLFAGSAFREYTCGICKEQKMYHNTAVPKFCPDCARDNNICMRCGSEMYKDFQV